MENDISVGVINTEHATIGDVLTTLFAIRTHMPQDHAIDFKYVIHDDGINIIVCTDNILLSGENDINSILSAIPSGTTRTLYDGTVVTVYQLEV